MACLSSSPPPMMPEDDEEEEDSSLAEGFADLSESDNAPFDLTGLSDKLHSIPKEAIHVTPKEVLMPDLGSESVIRLNGIGVPQQDPDVMDDVPELDEDDVVVPHLVDEEVFSHDKDVEIGVPDFNDDFPDLDIDSDPSNSDREAKVDDVFSDEGREEQNVKLESEMVDNVEQTDSEVKDYDSISQNSNVSEKLPGDLKLPVSEISEEFEIQEKSGFHSNNPTEVEQTENKCDSFTPTNDPEPASALAFSVEPSADCVDDESFGDFANFEANCNWVQQPQHEVAQPIDHVGVDQTEQRVLELDESEDDDFGDFDSADFAAPPLQLTPSSVPFQNVISMMRPKISTVIADLFSRPSDDNEDCDKKVEQSEHSKILNMNTGGEDDRVWTRIREIETTPALVMTWTKANSQSCLMKLLKIDPRNIVLEPKPRKFSPGGVPVFAMGLSTSSVLQPTKAETTTSLTPEVISHKVQKTTKEDETSTKVKSSSSEPIPPVVFDWQNSGLKNPLEQNGQPALEAASLKPRSSPKQSSSGATVGPDEGPKISNGFHSGQNHAASSPARPRSREATAILESFPLLNFMQSQALMIPAAKNN